MKTLILFFCILLTTFHLFGQCTHGDWHIVGPIVVQDGENTLETEKTIKE